MLGRHAVPDTSMYSVCLAIANLWLAARAEGIGVGWVSFYRKDELSRILSIPERVEPIAYLCVGPVTSSPAGPELEALRWESRRLLPSLVFEDRWHQPTGLFGPIRRRAPAPEDRKDAPTDADRVRGSERELGSDRAERVPRAAPTAGT